MTPESSIPLLLEAARLKEVARAGWLRVGIAAPESVADHSWGLAWMTLLLLPADLDRARALTYALLHDLAEVRTGDITPHDGISAPDKAAQEAAAMAVLLGERPDLLAAWQAYEARADAEARFVHQLDRLEMAVQAIHYAARADVHPFLDSAARVVHHPSLRPILDGLRALLPPEPGS